MSDELPPLPEPDEPYSPYYRADEMQAYAREAVRASRDSMRAAGWILVRADKAEKGLEPVRAFVDGLHQQKLPKKIFMESKYNGSQLMTYADDFAVQAIQQWITAHPPIQVEPVAQVQLDEHRCSVIAYIGTQALIPGTLLYAHPPTSEWNDAIEAAARLAETRPGEAAFVKAIRALKREPR